jgi:EAL domain-containing protein (putative c-di-GMP-specific phosphodiesterase class I)
MTVRAAGVQSREALRVAFDLGVTRFQGDFISEVLPQSEVLSWSRVHRRLAA